MSVSKEAVDIARAQLAFYGLYWLLGEGDGALVVRNELFRRPKGLIRNSVLNRATRSLKWQDDYLRRMESHQVLYVKIEGLRVLYGIAWPEYVKKIVAQKDENGGVELLWFLFPNAPHMRVPADIEQRFYSGDPKEGEEAAAAEAEAEADAEPGGDLLFDWMESLSQSVLDMRQKVESLDLAVKELSGVEANRFDTMTKAWAKNYVGNNGFAEGIMRAVNQLGADIQGVSERLDRLLPGENGTVSRKGQ